MTKTPMNFGDMMYYVQMIPIEYFDGARSHRTFNKTHNIQIERK